MTTRELKAAQKRSEAAGAVAVREQRALHAAIASAREDGWTLERIAGARAPEGSRPMTWTAKSLDDAQTVLFDLVMGEPVPSLKACDVPPEAPETSDDDG